MNEPDPYNPLDKANLGASVAEALLGRKPKPLNGLKSFKGAGLYAIYYNGPNPTYARLSALNRSDDPQAPIYVGKSVAEGARKGNSIKVGSSTTALFKRLCEHAESIRAAPSLNVDDFVCRHLVVDDIWIPLGESLLITKFTPVWNTLLEGFGNHDPGKGRYNGKCPRWDVVHPGRAWALRCKPRDESADVIAAEVQAHLHQMLPHAKPHFYIEEPHASFQVNRDDRLD